MASASAASGFSRACYGALEAAEQAALWLQVGVVSAARPELVLLCHEFSGNTCFTLSLAILPASPAFSESQQPLGFLGSVTL